MKKPAFILAALLLVPGFPSFLMADDTAKDPDAYSQEKAQKSFAAKKWYPGSYFLLGAGPSALSAVSIDEENQSLAGIHIFTALGYWALDAVGFEIGAIVSFNYFHDVTVTSYHEAEDGTITRQKLEDFQAIMWDSSFYWGVMVRWPFTRRTNLLNLYVRFFQGYGTSVSWLIEEDFDENDDDDQDTVPIDEASRFFSEGILFGFSFGNIFNAFNDKTTWFIQVSLYLKMFRQNIAIKDGGVLPEELAATENRNNHHQIQVNLTVGFRLY